jgi:DNA-binding response OmpR family regulator
VIVKQCRVLFVNPSGNEIVARKELEAVGFVVRQTREWPNDEMISNVEVMIVVTSRMEQLAMLAARIRAKRGFGQRVLVALVPAEMSPEDRRATAGAGFDDILPEGSTPRVLTARILRRLRMRPEHRCLLPRKRRAA